MINPQRVRQIKQGPWRSGPVVYWMSRDQRLQDNWALLFSQEIAIKNKSALLVIFCLSPKFLNASWRQYAFMLRGLQELKHDCDKKNIPFFILLGDPAQETMRFIERYHVSALVCDFDPLKIKRHWKNKVAASISIPFYEVDAHNIIPCWVASPQQEFGAYTIRPKINRLVDQFLLNFPRIKKHPFLLDLKSPSVNIDQILKKLDIDKSVSEVSWIKPGAKHAHQALRDFANKRLSDYNEKRNDPVQDGQSNLSPYLHFGQLSAQRVALSVLSAQTAQSVKDAFLEELIVRRELSDNFCYYNDHYDSMKGAPAWAQKTLSQHRTDQREHCYSLKEFETAKTHDDLWNAAQREMVVTGKMHGFMRMYWAKKILEWTPDIDQAFFIAIYLNDKYELDGRDPNGYAGIAWSLAGVHDRAWGERAIFGKIRYMSYNGCKNKFNINDYIKKKNYLKKG
jgi:deoxyribodipyrimidine photo-lyase